jgi:hypothetical protein
MSITYTATLPVRDETVLRISALLHAEQRRRGTRAGTRALTCYQQALLVLRWLLDDARMSQLARDNNVSLSTGYERLHEGIAVLAAQAPGLHCALLAAKAAGYDYVLLDGTLIETDRVSTPGPTAGVDLWWSAKHKNHGGNIQVLTAPDGWPLWTSGTARPRTRHHLPTHPPRPAGDPRRHPRRPTHLGRSGLRRRSRHHRRRVQEAQNGQLTDLQQTFNRAHNRLRAVGERGNSLLKVTFKALRNVSLNPWRIGDIAAAALAVLHLDHARTT